MQLPGRVTQLQCGWLVVQISRIHCAPGFGADASLNLRKSLGDLRGIAQENAEFENELAGFALTRVAWHACCIKGIA